METFLFTSESVGEGHPDKICDIISDTILDAHLTQDPKSKVAIETIVKNNTVILCGEITSKTIVDYDTLVRNVIREIGYNFNGDFDYRTVKIIKILNQQSVDIADAVSKDDMAGDQGLMFGYATDESEDKMPVTLIYAHKIVKMIKKLRKTCSWMRPDCKSQVTILYGNENGALVPLKVDNVVVSLQHDETIAIEELRRFVIENIIKEVIPKNMLTDTKFHVQPSGKFIIGGPVADTGLTGRKIIVDTYGGFGAHGGGCFSGKDCTKVDRSGAYAARWIAKSLVSSNLCRRALVQISYAIGMEHPLSVYVDTFGTSEYSNKDLHKLILANFDLRPASIIKNLGLSAPVFARTASFGHFGNDVFEWEKPKQLNITNSPDLEN